MANPSDTLPDDDLAAEAEVPYEAERLYEPEVLVEPVAVDERSLWQRAAWLAIRAPLTLMGAVTLIVSLAVVATIPILQCVSLGYLLEVSGRIARTGRLRDGFIGLLPAGKVGLAALALLVLWIPLRLAAGISVSGQIIAEENPYAQAWGGGVIVAILGMIFFAVVATLVAQWWKPGSYAALRDGLWHFVTERLPYYFWLGLRGFVGGMIWLALPITLLAAASLLPESGRVPVMVLAALLRLSGAVLLAVAVLYVPFLQTRLAADNRFSAVFELRAARDCYRRAPVAFFVALLVTLAFALPLYLLKIELVPRDAAWLPSLAFVIFMFPARVLAGWAVARGSRRPAPRHWIFRISGRMLMLPAAAFYVLIVFFSQYTGWHGAWGLYEQHAFLLPVPFLGL